VRPPPGLAGPNGGEPTGCEAGGFRSDPGAAKALIQEMFDAR
jgi:hypothetical protein